MVTNLPGAVPRCDLPVMALIWRIIDMNIVLTGFMGSGKSTCGKMLADITGMNFIDIDTLIEKKTGVTISEIFTHYGEKRFRELESNVIEEVSNMDGCVIATGGGAVMSSRNMDNLRKNGKIIYLHISYDKAMERTKKNIETRPLIHKGKGIKKYIMTDRNYTKKTILKSMLIKNYLK